MVIASGSVSVLGSVLGSVLLPVMHETYSMCLSMQWNGSRYLCFSFSRSPFYLLTVALLRHSKNVSGNFLNFLGQELAALKATALVKINLQLLPCGLHPQ